jgi:2-dehydro-3-deoxygluconokinase
MSLMAIKPKDACEFDELSLGEVMLRLDPGDMRISTTRHFTVWEGGGEYNVARGLRRCFGLRTAVVTALADNAVGRLLEDLMLQGGVHTGFVRWLPYDGVGRRVRNGLNFTERGFGVRGASGLSDRGHTAAAAIKAGDVDWEDIFGRRGVRWFHTGGIYAALSDTTAGVIEEAMLVARKHGTVVSYDLNFRPSLWDAFGGRERAREVNTRVVSLVDVLLGNEEDFTAALGFDLPDTAADLSAIEPENVKRMISQVTVAFPRLQVVATTLRTVATASRNDWGAVAWEDGRFHEATLRRDLDIYDRVGGGDSFAAGLIYGLMEKAGIAVAVEYGAAHGALAMTTPGDTSMASLAEVEALMRGAGTRVQR